MCMMGAFPSPKMIAEKLAGTNPMVRSALDAAEKRVRDAEKDRDRWLKVAEDSDREIEVWKNRAIKLRLLVEREDLGQLTWMKVDRLQ